MDKTGLRKPSLYQFFPYFYCSDYKIELAVAKLRLSV